jgi:osmoprotectant transport system permease protein
VNWLLNNLDLVWSLSLEHMRQSLAAIALGIVVSVPLGWLAWRFGLVRGPVVIGTGLIYTIPSLALLMVLPAVLGIPAFSELNLIIALALYAAALLVRGVVDGLASVSADTRTAAVATGYAPMRRFWSVDLPLAGPVILAALRVVAASTIALATVGSLIGVTNLGYLFVNGLQRRIVPEVLVGVVVTAALALLVDFALAVAGRRLMPWVERAAPGDKALPGERKDPAVTAS